MRLVYAALVLCSVIALGLPASACAFVGDGGDHELLGARRVGMRTVLVDRRLTQSASSRPDADIVADRLCDVRGAMIGAGWMWAMSRSGE